MDDRKASILRAIVSHYVRFGEPVGSKTIVEQYALRVSAATVRNEMVALEDLGYIYQPHTSAGRVPTDAGYRFVVDLSAEARLGSAEARRVRALFGEPVWELEEALRHAASLLSDLTHHAAVVFAPALDRSTVRHVQLVALSAGRAMLVLVTDTGRVENHVVLVPPEMDDVHLQGTAEMLNRVLQGSPLETAPATLREALGRFPLEQREVVGSVAGTLADALLEGEPERIFLEGTSNIVDEEKFADLETVRQVIEALEHRRLLFELLAESLSSEKVSVRIGRENPIREMQLCSVITASYGGRGHPLGSLGVVGPTRMDYGRTIAAVREVAGSLGRMLTGIGN